MRQMPFPKSLMAFIVLAVMVAAGTAYASGLPSFLGYELYGAYAGSCENTIYISKVRIPADSVWQINCLYAYLGSSPTTGTGVSCRKSVGLLFDGDSTLIDTTYQYCGTSSEGASFRTMLFVNGPKTITGPDSLWWGVLCDSTGNGAGDKSQIRLHINGDDAIYMTWDWIVNADTLPKQFHRSGANTGYQMTGGLGYSNGHEFSFYGGNTNDDTAWVTDYLITGNLNKDGYSSSTAALTLGQVFLTPYRAIIRPPRDISYYLEDGAVGDSGRFSIYCTALGVGQNWVPDSVVRLLKPPDSVTWNDWIKADYEWGTEGAANASDAGSDNTSDASGYDRLLTPEATVQAAASTKSVFRLSDTLVAGWVDGTLWTNGLLMVNREDTATSSTYYSTNATLTTSVFEKRPTFTIYYHVPAAQPRKGAILVQ